MTIKISLPVAIGLAVVALAILGFAAWKYFAPEPVPRDAQGNPTVVAPGPAQSGFNAMQDLWKRGVQPPTTQGGGR